MRKLFQDEMREEFEKYFLKNIDEQVIINFQDHNNLLLVGQ